MKILHEESDNLLVGTNPQTIEFFEDRLNRTILSTENLNSVLGECIQKDLENFQWRLNTNQLRYEIKRKLQAELNEWMSIANLPFELPDFEITVDEYAPTNIIIRKTYTDMNQRIRNNLKGTKWEQE